MLLQMDAGLPRVTPPPKFPLQAPTRTIPPKARPPCQAAPACRTPRLSPESPPSPRLPAGGSQAEVPVRGELLGRDPARGRGSQGHMSRLSSPETLLLKAP